MMNTTGNEHTANSEQDGLQLSKHKLNEITEDVFCFVLFLSCYFRKRHKEFLAISKRDTFTPSLPWVDVAMTEGCIDSTAVLSWGGTSCTYALGESPPFSDKASTWGGGGSHSAVFLYHLVVALFRDHPLHLSAHTGLHGCSSCSHTMLPCQSGEVTKVQEGAWCLC